MNHEDARRLPATIDIGSPAVLQLLEVGRSRAHELANEGYLPLVQTGGRRRRVATKPFLALLGIDWIGPGGTG